MADRPATSFGELLKRLRSEAGLTQEELGEAASVSARSISDLERGIALTARKETARLLADALHLAGTTRAAFEAMARGAPMSEGLRAVAATGSVAAATRTLPRDVASFTGRGAELDDLASAVSNGDSRNVVAIVAIGGMAGIGKTAFAVHAAHELAPRFPDGQIYLPLHGHTPGQRPLDPAEALASLLLTTGVAPQQIPPGLEDRTRLWRDRLAGMRLLLLLDDAAGHEQIRPLLPGTAGTLVLVTSRKHLTALEDAHTISLDTLPPDEAAELLIRLAARPGMRPGDTSVGDITRLCGYLPLAIGMLARQLHHHPARSCARLAAELAAAQNRLALMRAENLSVTAAFDLSYADLSADQQRLFRRLGLCPGTDIDAYAAAALDDTDLVTAQGELDVLYDHYLVTEPAYGRYRMHDLIRERARALADDDPVDDCDQAFGRLLDYYRDTALAAGRQLTRRSPIAAPALAGTAPACAPDLPTYDAAVAWMDAERLNLHSAASQAAAGDRHGDALAIAASMHGFLRNRGHWDQAQRLHDTELQAARAAGDRLAEAHALISIGEIRQLGGDYQMATATLTRALELYRGLSDKLGEASSLNELGVVQQSIDDNPAATASHEQALLLYRELGNRAGEASALNELGLVQRAIGEYRAALVSHEQALLLYRELGNRLGEASALFRLGQMQRTVGDYPEAIANHERALALHRDLGNRIGEATALYGLGFLHQAAGNYPAAIASQEQSLRLYRDLDYKFGEGSALNGLGSAQLSAGDPLAAAASYEQALRLHGELGKRIGQAEALNGLGAAHRAAMDYPAATASYERALRLCQETGHRPGAADALSGLGATYLACGDHPRAQACLARALDLYRDLGVRTGEAEVLNATGELLLATGDPAGALARHDSALTIATSINLRAEQARATEGIARCRACLGEATP